MTYFDLKNGPNVNMPIESHYRTLYLIAFVMFALSATAYEIFGFEICMTLILTFSMGIGQIKIYQSKANRQLLCIGHSNVCPICHSLLDIFTVKICMTLILIFRIGRGQM